MAEQKNENASYFRILELFRYFGIVLAIAVALAPLLTRYEDLLPMYAAQKEMLTFFATLVCLLALGVIFSIRRSISRLVFPLHTRAISDKTMFKRRFFRYYTPLIMILLSIVAMVCYYYILDRSVKLSAAKFSYSFDKKLTLHNKLEELINPKSKDNQTVKASNHTDSDEQPNIDASPVDKESTLPQPDNANLNQVKSEDPTAKTGENSGSEPEEETMATETEEEEVKETQAKEVDTSAKDKNRFYLFRQYGSNDALVTIDDFSDNGVTRIEDTTNYIKFDSENGYQMVLTQTPAIEIPYMPEIILSFVLIYLGSSVAFAWFGLIEYLQKENNLDDNDLLYNPYRVAKQHAFRIDAVDSPGASPTPLYFKFSYDPKHSPPVIVEEPSGPYVENYDKRLEYYGPDNTDSKFHVWAQRTMIDQQGDHKEIPAYTAKLKYDAQGLQELMYKAAYQEMSKLSSGKNE
ncbi:MAG: hypothetical protein P8Y28_01020 [Gammaproteobacteria bacterium]|jgi:hypothetical protein